MTASKKGNIHDNKVLTNTSLSLFSHFLPLLYLLELTIKNKLFYIIKEELGQEWFTNQLEAKNLDSLFDTEKEHILKRKRKNFLVTDKSLLYESGFGFWVEFFNTRIYKLTKGRPIKIFSKLPKEIKRKDLYERLDKIKDFRNQLYHSRIPPFTDKTHLPNLELVLKNYKVLIELLTWLDCPNLEHFDIVVFEKEVIRIKNILIDFN